MSAINELLDIIHHLLFNNNKNKTKKKCLLFSLLSNTPAGEFGLWIFFFFFFSEFEIQNRFTYLRINKHISTLKSPNQLMIWFFCEFYSKLCNGKSNERPGKKNKRCKLRKPIDIHGPELCALFFSSIFY